MIMDISKGQGLTEDQASQMIMDMLGGGPFQMAKSKKNHKRAPKSVLKLPDLKQSKSAVLNSRTSPSSQRTHDHAIREFIEWYCSEPRLAFNKTVVTRYRISRTAALCSHDH
jgi:hypothetical protein